MVHVLHRCSSVGTSYTSLALLIVEVGDNFLAFLRVQPLFHLLIDLQAGQDDGIWLHRLLPLAYICLRVQIVGLTAILLAEVLQEEVLLGGVHQERSQEDL